MADEKLIDDTITELQARNERLKHLSKDWLKEKKTLSDKLKKIEQIINEKHYSVKSLKYEIKEVLEKE